MENSVSFTSVFENVVDSYPIEGKSSHQEVESFDVNAQRETKNQHFNLHNQSQATYLPDQRWHRKKSSFIYVFGYEQRPVIFPHQDMLREANSKIQKPDVIDDCPNDLSLGPSLKTISLAWANIPVQVNGVGESSSLNTDRESVPATGLISSSSGSFLLSNTHDNQEYQSQQTTIDYSSLTLSNDIANESVRRYIQPQSVAMSRETLICDEMLQSAHDSSLGVNNLCSFAENQDWATKGRKSTTCTSPRLYHESDLPMLNTQPEICEMLKRGKRPKKLLQSCMKRLKVEELMNDIPPINTRLAGIYFKGKRLENVGKSTDRRGNSTQPSRFCHICLRRAERVPLMACGRLRSGLCRKVVCEKCFIEFGYDWDAAACPNSDWLCPHCREM